MIPAEVIDGVLFYIAMGCAIGAPLIFITYLIERRKKK